MIRYTVDSKATGRFSVCASSVEDAARISSARINGRKRGGQVQRVTGDPQKSGVFQLYLPVPTGGLSSYGEQFHVF